MDLSTVGAVVGTAMLSGGGAGYLVSIYTARKESEDRKEALQLERDKFEHERQKYRDEQKQARILRTSTFDARRAEALRQAHDSISEVDALWRNLWFSARTDGPITADQLTSLLEQFHAQFPVAQELFYVDCMKVAGDLNTFFNEVTQTLNSIAMGDTSDEVMEVYVNALTAALESVRQAELNKQPEKTPESQPEFDI